MATNAGDAITVNRRSVAIISAISAGYLFLSWVLVGFKSDEILLLVIFNGLFYASPLTRKFILGFSIFILYWIIFDWMKAFPNYLYNQVHIADLYRVEKNWFGLHDGGRLVTANEYWLAHCRPAIDVVGGFFYLCWVPVPLLFAGWLFARRKKEFLYFALTFFTVNMLGFIIYYLFPAAPPWYVQLHGFKFIAHTPGNTGGLARFDHFFNITLFKGIYAKGSNVFAAMPSLHSAYPVIVLYYGLKSRLGWINVLFFIVMLGIWFTAVYASHHYIADVLAGILCAASGIMLFNLLAGQKPVQKFLTKYIAVIT